MESRPDGANDLVSFWVYETKGGSCVERRVPLLPLSREQGQLRRLKRGLVLYRLRFGQPRQEDVLDYLSGVMTEEEQEQSAGKWRIDLSPPRRR